MNDFLDHLSANDNDIYDLLMSGKQRLTEAVLREFARDRGIFCSPQDTRDELADYLSLLPHGFHDVSAIVQRREPLNRRERLTSIRLGASLPIEELKVAAQEYESSVNATERVVHRRKDGGGFVVDVAYNEYNYGRTRLLQVEKHEAEIEFFLDGEETVIRFPATDKAKRIVSALKESVERQRKEKIKEDLISLAGLTSPALRSKFFTRLISSLEGYKLKNVMNLRVSSSASQAGDDEMDADDDQDASEEMLAVVHSMALSGQNLVQSQEYKDLTARGFFITSISWRAEQEGAIPDIFQLEAGFEDRRNGAGFKYAVHGAFRSHKGTHRKTIGQLDGAERAKFLALIEKSAKQVLSDLLSEAEQEGKSE